MKVEIIGGRVVVISENPQEAHRILAMRVDAQLRRQDMSELPKKPKPPKDCIMSRFVMYEVQLGLTRLADKLVAAVPMPMPTLDEALEIAMTPELRDIMRIATEQAPSRVTRVPSYEFHTINEAMVFHVQFQFEHTMGMLIPDHVPWRPEHGDMPAVQEMLAYAKHRLNVSRQFTQALHFIEYLNVACSSLRQLRFLWPEFAGVLKGTKNKWGEQFIKRFEETKPGDAPVLFPSGMRYLNDAKGAVAVATMAVPAEPRPKDKQVEVNIYRNYQAEPEFVPWHDQIVWPEVHKLSPRVAETMQWIIR
jgi:hypothetical protein